MNENKLLIPGAIVIAGLLIGGAVVFKTRGTSPTSPTQENTTTPVALALPAVSADDHMQGNPNASIVMVEFSDIDCPFCSNFHTTMKRVMDIYGKEGSVAWVYRHFPLKQIHPDAELKAQSTECAAELGGNDGFWKYLDTLFMTTDETPQTLGTLAAQNGIDQNAFNTCVTSKRYAQKVSNQSDQAVAAGGRGTPFTILVSKEKINNETLVMMETLMQQFNKPGQEIFRISEDKKRISMSGALPFEVVSGLLDSMLGKPAPATSTQ
jgi:protein-disulfide isomerase